MSSFQQTNKQTNKQQSRRIAISNDGGWESCGQKNGLVSARGCRHKGHPCRSSRGALCTPIPPPCRTVPTPARKGQLGGLFPHPPTPADPLVLQVHIWRAQKKGLNLQQEKKKKVPLQEGKTDAFQRDPPLVLGKSGACKPLLHPCWETWDLGLFGCFFPFLSGPSSSSSPPPPQPVGKRVAW